MNSGKLNTLQALRGVAASFVVIAHTLRQTHELWPKSKEIYVPAILLGDFGVYVFFLISGFIMMYTAADTAGRTGAPAQFMQNRLVRIVPMYWVFTAIAIVFPDRLYLGHHVTIVGAISSLVFFPDVSAPPSLNPALMVGWTLNFEMLFYIVFALSLYLTKNRAVVFLVIAIFTIAIVARQIGENHAVPEYLRDFARWWGQGFVFLFVIGVCLALLRERIGEIRDRANIAFCCAIALMIASAVWIVSSSYSGLTPALQVILILASVATVSLCVLFQDVGDKGLAKPLVWLGTRSYGLYLSHLVILGSISSLWLFAFSAPSAIWYSIIGLAICWLWCWPIHALFETKLTRWVRRIFQNRTGDRHRSLVE